MHARQTIKRIRKGLKCVEQVEGMGKTKEKKKVKKKRRHKERKGEKKRFEKEM